MLYIRIYNDMYMCMHATSQRDGVIY